ncbi:MAG: nitrous oxide reductase family maturation protein NosD [Chitinophagaceae bacterium]|nr:MAG: nitrous oxide reductase family maturation protein NosD [Chitinophagaceae bacterium]
MIRWLLIFVFISGSNSSATTLRVGSDREYKTINSAIHAAKDGDTILVDKGLYREQNIIINKSVALIGTDYPILDGEKKYEIISVTGNGVTVAGFRIMHSGISSLKELSGIRVYDCRNVNLTNNILEDTYFGIYIQAGINCLISNNKITAHNKQEQQSGNGIHCWKSDSMRIIANTIEGHRDGIYFEFVKNSVIWRNSAKNNIRYGLHFMFSNDDAYLSNYFSNNGSGVSVMFSSRIKMFSNYFKENWGDAAHGILLKEISDGYMQGNHFSKNTSAIFMEGANRIYMKSNTFENNGWAMKIQASCTDVTLEQNIFTGNTFDVGTNGSLTQNIFFNNYWDKYEGYDLNRDKIGDIPYRPVSLYSMIVEKNPPAMILFRSFISAMMDKTEKVLPSITPENLKDEKPLMKKPF